MDCQFQHLRRGAECPNCDQRELRRDYTKPPRRVCKAKEQLPAKKKPCDQPGLKQMAYNYAAAVKKWKAAGKPRRSEPEITRIHIICAGDENTPPCEHFVAGLRPHCGLCGCTCSQGQNPIFNKIAMATESCAADPPKWMAEVLTTEDTEDTEK